MATARDAAEHERAMIAASREALAARAARGDAAGVDHLGGRDRGRRATTLEGKQGAAPLDGPTEEPFPSAVLTRLSSDARCAKMSVIYRYDKFERATRVLRNSAINLTPLRCYDETDPLEGETVRGATALRRQHCARGRHTARGVRSQGDLHDMAGITAAQVLADIKTQGIVACFSSDDNNHRLWEQQNHTGIMFGFDESCFLSCGVIVGPKKVQYLEKSAYLALQQKPDLDAATPRQRSEYYDKLFEEALFRKTDDFDWEKEVRIASEIKYAISECDPIDSAVGNVTKQKRNASRTDYHFKFPQEAIVLIVLGFKVNLEDKAFIELLRTYNTAEIKRATTRTGDYMPFKLESPGSRG